jgi:hypothetical protein
VKQQERSSDAGALIVDLQSAHQDEALFDVCVSPRHAAVTRVLYRASRDSLMAAERLVDFDVTARLKSNATKRLLIYFSSGSRFVTRAWKELYPAVFSRALAL